MDENDLKEKVSHAIARGMTGVKEIAEHTPSEKSLVRSCMLRSRAFNLLFSLDERSRQFKGAKL